MNIKEALSILTTLGYKITEINMQYLIKKGKKKLRFDNHHDLIEFVLNKTNKLKYSGGNR